MTSLRLRVVEAGARAVYERDDAYRDSWDSQPEEGVKDWYRKMFAAGFGGALDCLTENADEWDSAAYAALDNQDDLFDSGYASLLLAALREPTDG